MHSNRIKNPPRWAAMLLSWYCKPEMLEDLNGDLTEYFYRNIKAKGALRARIIYCVDVLKFIKPYTMRKISPSNYLQSWTMIGSYLKTSGRSLIRNKLFSFINVVGLAVSMSVGLLVVALASDFFSYDTFHKDGEDIYRVETKNQNDPHQVIYATTSYQTGLDILEQNSDHHAVTVISRNFGGDMKTDSKTVPIGGFWASHEFFDVFTFPLVHGDPKTALRDPFSLVLSESAAIKLFNTTDVVGKSISMDSLDYVVTGVMQEIPKLSHFRTEAVASLVTRNNLLQPKDSSQLKWSDIYSHYVYLRADKKFLGGLESALQNISTTENKIDPKANLSLSLQPLSNIVFHRVTNPPGPTFPSMGLWIIEGLALIVILSACFNYTNLSIARSIRRGREVGIRKVIGARKTHILGQFVIESVLLSLGALMLSFVMFLFLRSGFLNLNPFIRDLVTLDLSPVMITRFIIMALMVGLAAGIFPAFIFSKVHALRALKDAATVKIQGIPMRKALIVVQYSFSLIFITTTLIGYHQYASFVSFDLGFKTDNILNVRIQQNKTDILKKELAAIPGVNRISVSRMVTSVGSIYGTGFTYNNNQDTASASINAVDEYYLSIHNHKLLAGRNFLSTNGNKDHNEVVVTKKLLDDFNIADKDPWKAIGQELGVDGKPMTIVGVVPDFHYGTVEQATMPVLFVYSENEPWGFLNLEIESNDLIKTMDAVEQAWKKVDDVHPLDAKFYNDEIQRSYGQFIVMVKVFGFLSFLAICIASMGLFGMVVFTTETRLKEISIRKVLGASEGGVVYLLSRSFLALLVLSAVLSLPATYYFFDRIVLVNFVYHDPIRLSDMILGFAGITVIALVMIGSQTFKAARTNPAEILKNE